VGVLAVLVDEEGLGGALAELAGDDALLEAGGAAVEEDLGVLDEADLLVAARAQAGLLVAIDGALDARQVDLVEALAEPLGDGLPAVAEAQVTERRGEGAELYACDAREHHDPFAPGFVGAASTTCLGRGTFRGCRAAGEVGEVPRR